MQRSTSNSDFFCTGGGRTRPFQTMKIYICTMIDRRNQPKGRKCFPRAPVLTKLQSLQLESMRRNFHVKLAYITIDKISGIVLPAVWTKISKLQRVRVSTYDTSGWRHMYSCFAMFATFDSYAKFISPLFLYTLQFWTKFFAMKITWFNLSPLPESNIFPWNMRCCPVKYGRGNVETFDALFFSRKKRRKRKEMKLLISLY